MEKLARLIAERLEVGVTVVSKDLDTITNQLDLYRLMQIEQKQQERIKQIKILTEAEIKEAQAFLQQPHLVQRTNELIGESGVVGEELNRLIMYLIFINRKREKQLQSHQVYELMDYLHEVRKQMLSEATDKVFFNVQGGENFYGIHTRTFKSAKTNQQQNKKY